MTARGFLGVLLLFLISAMSVIAWRYLFPGDSLEALANHCAELGLPVHSVVLVPGSEREARFKFLIPVGNRARVADTNRWLFCHTNPRID